jgi:hypothetical protein
MWNIFYDPLLCQLGNHNGGYILKRSPHHPVDIRERPDSKITNPIQTKTHKYLQVPEEVKIDNVAFIEDLALAGESTQGMQ